LHQQSAINAVRALKTRQGFSRNGYPRFYLMATGCSLLVWAVCYRETALRFFGLLMRIRQKYDGQTGFFIAAKANGYVTDWLCFPADKAGHDDEGIEFSTLPL